jgi:tRNA nucleotidyltransferase/poly(A) polymerase
MPKDLVLSAERSIKDIKHIFGSISRLARKYKTRAFLVGGPVRDLIIHGSKTISEKPDLDIAVENKLEHIAKELAVSLNAEIIRYPQFMTITLKLDSGRHIDLAQTRQEIYPQPAMLPIVKKANLNEDLRRRDFTVNAMAIEIKPTVFRHPLSIVDPFNGRQDIKNKLIRVLHPKSFIDDPTRIFRAIRFAVRFGFTIEKLTDQLMQKAVCADLLKLLSGERILYELKLIMLEEKSAAIIKELQKRKVIKVLFGVTLPVKFLVENNMLAPEQRLAHFFSYVPESSYLKYPLTKETINTIKALKTFSVFRSKLLKAQKPSAIYKTLKPVPVTALEILSVLEKSLVRNKINLYLNKYAKVKIFSSGQTLKQSGLLPGRIFSELLSQLLYLKLDGRLKTKTDEINYLRKIKNV